MRTRSLAATAALAAGAFVGLAGPAEAAPQQNGLVNVNLSNIDVQVPVGVAANVCDVSVAVLAQLGPDAAAPCNASADPDATITRAGDGSSPNQRGLVNVNASDIAVQIPIGVAANVCDLNVAVLAELPLDTAAPCTASAAPGSTITIVG